MKALFIGGTGTISTAISRLVLEQGWELYLLNRGSRSSELKAADKQGGLKHGMLKHGMLTEVACDIRAESEESVHKKVLAALGGKGRFDVVADFIAYVPEHVAKDFAVFRDLCDQYFFISSASAYHKPPASHIITEGTSLANPFWQYSRDKIACEEFLAARRREDGFPVTIIRPSHTYDERSIPLGVHGKNGSWQVAKRMLEGKPVIIHGDGTSLWTMTHNTDFAAAFAGLMGNIHAIGEAVQITSDESLTWNQIYLSIAGALDVPLTGVHISSEFLARAGAADGYDFTGTLIGDKANSVVFDNAKLKRLVPGFCARVRFDQGIRQTIAHILTHRECQKDDPEFEAWCDRVIAANRQAVTA